MSSTKRKKGPPDPVVLHLSDTHLDPDWFEDDHKSGIVRPDERLTRRRSLCATLRDLPRALREANKELYAVLWSGDITVGNREQGYQALAEILGALGNASVPNERIVVVPGNHDVRWETAPGSPERYKNFLKYVRDAKYITPLLDGVDLPLDEGSFVPDRHFLLGPRRDWVIVPINSANYCGSLESLEGLPEETWKALPERLAQEHPHLKREAIEGLLRRLRLYDVVRISHDQFEALRRLLGAIDKQLAESDGEGKPSDLLKIALIHHHLLPVSPVEEFKAFESITNLGQLRDFLSANGFQVVLHGHKHTGLAYWDHVYDPDLGASGEPHRVLVISGSTLGGMDYRRAEVARVVEFRARRFAPSVVLAPVPAVAPGARLRPLNWRRFQLWGECPSRSFEEIGVTAIRGDTLDQTYARIQALFDEGDPHDQITNLVCQVVDAGTVGRIPEGYPCLPAHTTDRNAWFDELVGWWQAEQTERAKELHFNHGGRIHAPYQGRSLLDRAVQALAGKSDSSRSVVALLHAHEDLVDQEAHKFPSFCLVQFLIVRGAGRPRLDCIGYFRKQELRYWWPINMAELARLQDHVLKRLRGRPRGLIPGAITTVAACAYAGNSPPQVAVPLIDRAVDERPEELLAIAHALVWREMPERDAWLQKWNAWLDDVIPAEERDPDGPPIATIGLEELHRLAVELAQHHSGSFAEPLLRSLKDLHSANADYLRETLAETAASTRYNEWRTRVLDLVQRIRSQIG